MKASRIRKFHRQASAKKDNAFFKKDARHEHAFFSGALHETFFQPNSYIQRKCENCKEEEKVQRMTDKKEEEKKVQRQPEKKEEEKKVMKKENGSAGNAVTGNYLSNLSGGHALPQHVNQFYGSRMGEDFSHVKIHNDKRAAESAEQINARAYTIGNHIVFNEGEYNHSSTEGKKLLAHELTHVVQQDKSISDKVQRAVKFNVTEWKTEAGKPPALENKYDFIVIPPKRKHVVTDALVEVNGSAGDNCTEYEFGITQSSWLAWTKIYYHGRKPGDGSVIVEYNPSLPMRDPSDKGDIWYDNSFVNSPGSCGDTAGAFHGDGPWHEFKKTEVNTAVAGKPLNYATGYTRGLHNVVYLTGKKKGGDFFKTPLKYRYWNSIHDFSFKPNFENPASSWTSSGAIKINVGGQGSGETGDAPYFTSSGTTFNTHFNDSANWTTTAKKS